MKRLTDLAALAALTLAPAVVAQNNLDAGRALYDQHCASCHGRDLTGGNAQSMVDGVWRYGADRGSKFRNIKFGISAYGMPAYQDALDDRQVNQLIGFIENAERTAGAQRPPLPDKLETRDYDVNVKVLVDSGLDTPWGLTFIDKDTALLTERPGRLRLIVNGELREPVQNTPAVFADGQGGLLDVAIDPHYADNGWVYLSYAHRLNDDSQEAMTRVVRGQIRDNAWVDEQVLFQAPAETYLRSGVHYGSRLTFGGDGMLYFSIGERGQQDHAQDLTRPNGKVHRIHPDGTVPADNPFVDSDGAIKSIYTYGNRNPQGLATHPATGAVWETEHGPMGGDELNLVAGGVNYGWPVITYGLNYNGEPVSSQQQGEGMAQPILYWTPSIAVCGIDFCIGDEFPRWENNLFVTGLGHEELRRLNIIDGRVMYDEVILKNHGRVRDVAVAPDGAVYVVLNNPDKVLMLTNGGAALRQ